MFQTIKYKDGWIQTSNYDGVFRVYAQLYKPYKDKDGITWVYETKKCKTIISAKRWISINI